MTKLVKNIFEKNFDLANQLAEEKIVGILEQKLVEMKKMIMAKEQRQAWTGMPGSRQEKLYRDVLEEDDLEEMDLSKEPSAMDDIEDRRTSVVQNQNKTSLPGTQNTNDEGKGDLKTTVIQKNMNKLKESDDMGPVKARERVKDYRHKTSGKEISSTKHPGKEWELVKEEQLEEMSNLKDADNLQIKNMQKSFGKDGAIERIMSPVNRDPKFTKDQSKSPQSSFGVSHDKQNRGLSPPASNLLNKAKEYLRRSTPSSEIIKEEETLEEARIKIVKARIRGGKIQRRKKVSNVPGMTFRGGKLTRMSPAERRRRKMGQRKGKMKRRAKMVRTLMKRRRSLQKRRTLGLG